MIETLTLILTVVGLICLIAAMVAMTLVFLIWVIQSIIDDIKHNDSRWYF